MVEGSPSLGWRNYSQRYNLAGNECKTCGKHFFPAVALCPTCRRKGKLVETKMPMEGRLLSYSKVFVGPVGFEMDAPYHLGLVKLQNNVKILAEIVDTPENKIKIGSKVRKVFRKIHSEGETGTISYGYKFRVV